MIHYHIIMASLVSPFLDLIIVGHYLLVKTWFSLVLKTRKATQSLLTCLSIVYTDVQGFENATKRINLKEEEQGSQDILLK